MKILIINGPNINLLGKREPKFYGVLTWNDIENEINALAQQLNVTVLVKQSNHEGVLVDYIQEEGISADGIIINPAAFTISGYSILEAIGGMGVPLIEIHMSNIYARGGWHKETIFASSAIGQIAGFQGNSYLLALRAMVNFLTNNNSLLKQR